jgi:hypothetical protein
MGAGNEPVLRAVASVLKDHLGRIGERLRGLDARIDSMQTNLADCYQGVWREGSEYQRGQLLTHGGGLWLVMRDTSDRPGTSDAIRLIVKRGQTP